MNSYRRTLKTAWGIAALAACFCFLVLFNITQTRKDSLEEKNENQTYFRSFSLQSLDGGAVTATDIAGNKVTVFNGWAPWCNPCTGEMPDLERLNREYQDRGLQVIGIAADYYQQTESGTAPEVYQEEIRNAAALTGVTYPVVLSDEAFYKALGADMSGYPTTWAVDADGNIIETVVGGRDEAAWRAFFEKWLEEAS